LIKDLTDEGIGECTCRGELPPRRFPWFFDNGAFRDWTAEKPFNEPAFIRDLERLREMPAMDFLVAPDVVAGGMQSLDTSISWLQRIEANTASPIFIAVQDGMTPEGIADRLDGFAGIFVGGTLPWKLRTGHLWCDMAHKRGLICHIGRVGTAKRVHWARRAKADSIDSCLPLWSHANMTTFLRALNTRQLEWWM
jgi:hypothetical protein